MIVLPEEKCMGFNTRKKQRISEWFEEQLVNQLNEESLNWNNFLIELKEDPVIKNKEFKEMFKKIFYGFDDTNISMEELYKQFNETKTHLNSSVQ